MSTELKTEKTDRFHTFRGVSFGGIACAQYYADFYVWEAILNDNMHVEGIMEIGTFKGGFSRYLAAQAQARGILFRTYDVRKPDEQIPGFVQLDVFAHIEQVGWWIENHDPLIILCDGGNKSRELNTFSLSMGKDSVIATHDWGTEVKPEQVPPWLDMVYGDFCEDLGSVTRFFKRNDV